MAYTTINKPSSYFNTVLYTGNGASPRSITGVGFKPDFVWSKQRSAAENHNLYDAVRGGANSLRSNLTNAENASSIYGYVSTFDSDGVTYISGGTNNDLNNGNGITFVNWNWLAANSTATNTQGSITSTVSANTTSGFSIVSYTGNGTNGATVGHGLGVAPKMVIVKSRSNASTDWAVYHASLTAGNMLFLNTTGASGAISTFDNGGINPVSSTTFTTAQGGVSKNNVNTSSYTYIAYCFAEVKGFSKFGSYTGNGSTDGTFVYTGFKPAYLLIKRSDSVSQWRVWDNKRNTYNVTDTVLLPNDSGADVTNSSQYVDLLSNGFKWRASYVDTNASGGTFIYMAFAENPFVSATAIPTTAR
jgi:hypothetical protein